jgi:hypothetical protein
MHALLLASLIAIAGQPAQVEPTDAWTEATAPDAADGPVLVLHTDAGGLMAITVAMSPNADAWRDSKKAAWIAAVIDGMRAQPGVKVKSAKPITVKGVPCIDFALIRDGKPVAVRLLLFRTRTIAAAVEGVSASAGAAAIRALVPTREVDTSR